MKLIGITQRVEVFGDFKERRDCLDQRWAPLLTSLGYCPVPLANCVKDVEAYLATLQLTGVILSGGNDVGAADDAVNVAPERDRFEHQLLEVCSATQLPVLGVCRGAQMICTHYGGRLASIDHHISERHKVSLTPGVFSGWPADIEANSFHRHGISELSEEHPVKAIAWAEDGSIEGLAHLNLTQFGIMWHPEREDVPTPHDLSMLREIFGPAFGQGQ